MSDRFFESPILNSPYDPPKRHWELNADGQPTHQVVETRRKAEFITPIPKPKKRISGQQNMVFEDAEGLSNKNQQYELQALIQEVRNRVGEWRESPERDWNVTPETARLLKHWRHHNFSGVRPFFCQIEAVETVIWLTEAAPSHPRGKVILETKSRVSDEANPGLVRLALKLATGAGKTTVMAMIIAWQTVNSVRRPGSKNFTKGFLVCAPGLTIKDRLRVLQPNDPNSYYAARELVPTDMLEDLGKAKIVITNFHAFKLRERMEISAGGRALLKGRLGGDIETTETEGQMLQRVMPDLMGMKNILVINDEAHHCYREKPEADDEDLAGEDRKESEKNREAARLWISGIEAVTRKLGVSQVLDLSATPFFLSGSGYAEGTLFPWTMSDFSLMDAIESGIVKLPRVPIAENIPGNEMPMYRNIWAHIKDDMPKKGRGNAETATADPLKLPTRLQTAIHSLYGHYEATFDLWQKSKIKVPPCFIIVCQNTAISKLVYDFIAGFEATNADESKRFVPGRLELFRNFDEFGNPESRLRTLLIDSEQLEAGDTIDDNFRKLAKDEIEKFKRERVERTGNIEDRDNISDQELLREVMNTVGKHGQLGGEIRCVVSVSMLTEGWDANTVTHVLGVRAFGTQLLCEQVIGRALRRQSYDLNTHGLFDVEYADVFGIPFDFTAQPVKSTPTPPRESVLVKAMSPERDALEIRFPRVEGYRVELPVERFTAKFTDVSRLVLSPELIGPTITSNSGIIGAGIDLGLAHTAATRNATIVYHLTNHLIKEGFGEPNHPPRLDLFGQLKRITRQWLETCVECKGGTFPAQLLYPQISDMACQRIRDSITSQFVGDRPIKAILSPLNPYGSSRGIRFNTSKELRWETDPRKCHVNWVVCDSNWEAELCRVVESHPSVQRYVKNDHLGIEVPYRSGSDARRYLPDFVIMLDDGHGPDNPLHLVVEIKGYRRIDADDKKRTMQTYWIPAVNNLRDCGRWAFAEFTDMYSMSTDFSGVVDQFNKVVADAMPKGVTAPSPS